MSDNNSDRAGGRPEIESVEQLASGLPAGVSRELEEAMSHGGPEEQMAAMGISMQRVSAEELQHAHGIRSLGDPTSTRPAAPAIPTPPRQDAAGSVEVRLRFDSPEDQRLLSVLLAHAQAAGRSLQDHVTNVLRNHHNCR